MFDHKHGVADVAQLFQRVEQPVVVALVQSDRRFVENVQDADQPAAELGRQPDPLRLAARKRARHPVQRQIVQPDVAQKGQAAPDLLQDVSGDHRVFAFELQAADELLRGFDRKRVEFVEAETADRHREADRIQPRAMADRALLRTQVFAQPLAHGVGFGLFHAAAQVVEHAFERLAPAVLFTVHPVFKFERFAAAAVQDGAAHLLRQLFERHGQHVRLLQPLGQLAQQQIVVDDQMARTAPASPESPRF